MPLQDNILEQLLLLDDKVDSPERLAMFQAFGIEKYADAAHFNLLRDALIDIYQNGNDTDIDYSVPTYADLGLIENKPDGLIKKVTATGRTYVYDLATDTWRQVAYVDNATGNVLIYSDISDDGNGNFTIVATSYKTNGQVHTIDYTYITVPPTYNPLGKRFDNIYINTVDNTIGRFPGEEADPGQPLSSPVLLPEYLFITQVVIFGDAINADEPNLPQQIVQSVTGSVPGLVDNADPQNPKILPHSQLEIITEGGKTGYRLKGRNPLNFGNIGNNAVDFSISETESSFRGATGNGSFAEGSNNIVSGSFAHGEGRGNTASGLSSHVEGEGNAATNFGAHSEGINTIASAYGSHAEGGGGATASGDCSHAEGWGSIASGKYSHAEGEGNFARANTEHSGGMYGTDYVPSNSPTDRVVNYGNGHPAGRRDAWSLFRNGAHKFFTAALSTVTNASKGFFMLDENARPHIHNGTEWKPLAYLGENSGGAPVKTIKTVTDTAYTIVAGDADKILHFTAVTNITVTVPAGLATGLRFEGKQLGGGFVNFVGANGITLRTGASEQPRTAERYSVFQLDWIGENEYMLFGKLALI